MSLWILLVVVGQFLTATVALVDKYVVTSKTVAKPTVYAFYVGILSALAVGVFFLPWKTIPILEIDIPTISNISIPSLFIVIASFIAGLSFIGALIYLFTALAKADASDVVPIVGAASALASLSLAALFLNERLTPNFLWGFAILVIGTLTVSQFRLTYHTTVVAIVAGVLFGVHFVTLKVLFEETHFDDALFWSRFGIAIIALSLLLLPSVRKNSMTRSECRGSVGKAGVLIVGNKFIAGAANFLILKAIEIGSVSVVQALGGLQFVFLLLYAAFFGRKLPASCGEQCRRRDLIQKLISTSIIVVGFALLFV